MNINTLNHYPRFVFNCSDGKCFSTLDLDHLQFITKKDYSTRIESFNTGEIVSIKWDDSPKFINYKVSKIDI